MINDKNIFDQQIKDNKVRYENIRKIVAGQADDYTSVITLKITVQ